MGLLSVILVISTSSADNIFAQEATTDAIPTGEMQASITPLMSYQGRLVNNGVPVEGNISMIFRLYAVSSGGTEFWSETQVVSVNDGLFQVSLGSVTPFDETVLGQLDQNLWLEITVGVTTLPRQQLMGAPYAFSLVPGAAISGSVSTGALSASNAGSGAGIFTESAASHGINAISNGVGLNGAAMKAEAINSSGIAAWAKSNSWDATLVTSNNGTGPLVKGFGGNGGEHEFIILNDGTFQQALDASGLVKAAVYAYCANAGSTIMRSFNNVWGTISIMDLDVGICAIDFGFPVEDRYFMVTAPVVTGYNEDTFATCGVMSGYPTTLVCMRENYAGIQNNGFIMILVY